MTEQPILFSAEMVRAILEGRKTQTRRVMKPAKAKRPKRWLIDDAAVNGLVCPYGAPGDLLWVRETFCAHWNAPPHDAPASHRVFTGSEMGPIRQKSGEYYQPQPSDLMTVWYSAEGNKPFHMSWRPSIHMWRWASRITLRITDVRVERLQAISEDDAQAEGCQARPFPGPWWQGYRDLGDGEMLHQQAVGETPPDWMIEPKKMPPTPWLDLSARDGFRSIWMDLHGPGAWDENPWVWVLSFERVKP